MHYGEERSLGPRPYQHRINKHLMSLGVHVIIGSHPHVLQPHCVTEDNKVIAYSLGNFLFYPNRPMGGSNPVRCLLTYLSPYKRNILKIKKKLQSHNVICTGRGWGGRQILLFLYFIGCLGCAWYCGKLYSPHRFS